MVNHKRTDYPDIDMIKKIDWKIFTRKELRYLLHLEYMNQHLEEKITPKRLKIHLKPSIQEESL